MYLSLPSLFRLFLLASTLLFSACSSTTLAYKDTLELVFFPGDDVELSLKEIQQRQIPALYVRINDKPRALLALAQTSETQQRWISSDYGLLVLQQGRMVKLLGLQQQLLGQTVRQQDWLSKPLGLLRLGDQSQLVSDWSEVQFRGMESKIEVTAITNDTLTYFDQQLATTRVDEQVTFSSGEVVSNSFWFSATNGVLLKTQQQPLPNWIVFEVEFISEIANIVSLVGR